VPRLFDRDACGGEAVCAARSRTLIANPVGWPSPVAANSSRWGSSIRSPSVSTRLRVDVIALLVGAGVGDRRIAQQSYDLFVGSFNDPTI
jgi:hypothetical protein